MNQSEFKKGIRGFKKLALTNSEKNLVLKNILGEVPNYKMQPSWFNTVEILFSRSAPIFVVALIVFGTLAFGSEKAIPGESLYPIKVGVVEPLRAAVEITPEAKAEWESVRSVRRLNEALELAAKGEFDEKARQDIEKRFEKHVESFDALIEKMPANATSSKSVEIEFEEEVVSKVNAFKDSIEQIEPTEFEEKKKKEKKEDTELEKFKKRIEEKLEKRSEERGRNREKNEKERDRD